MSTSNLYLAVLLGSRSGILPIPGTQNDPQ
jgi:hypothetical protein